MRILALIAILSLCCSITVSFVGFGYGQAGIGGKVYAREFMGDFHEAVGAKVTAFDGSTVYEATFTIGSQYYIIVPPGTYLVNCSLTGYVGQSFEVTVQEGGSVTLNFYLEQSREPEPDPEDLETTPVGGYVMSVSKITILMPYFVLVTIMITFVLVSIMLKRYSV